MSKKISNRIIVVVLVLVVAALVFSGCKAEQTVEEETVQEETAIVEEEVEEEAAAEETVTEKKLVFGNIPAALSDEWNGYSVENFKFAADKVGVDVIVLDPAWDGTKALNNLEDLITRQVDSIGVFVLTPEEAQKFIDVANVAEIPISFENTELVDNPYSVPITGDYLFNVCEDYYDLGYEAIKYIGENYPGAKVFHVRGAPGMGIAELIQDGATDAMEEFGLVTQTVWRDTGWDTETAQNAVADVIQAGDEFTVIFSNNESMAVGVHNALKDAGLDGQIPIIATNGGPTGIKMIQEGTLEATIAVPVSIQGLYMFKAMYLKAAKGIDPPQLFLRIDPVVINKDNLDEIVPWAASDELIDLIGGLESWDEGGIYLD